MYLWGVAAADFTLPWIIARSQVVVVDPVNV